MKKQEAKKQEAKKKEASSEQRAAKSEKQGGEAPRFAMLAVAELVPTPENKRKIDEKGKAFVELLASVKSVGVQIPVACRPHPTKPGLYDLRAGARRHRAAVIAGVPEIPALVYEDMSDEAAFDLTFIENCHRDDLAPIEQGEAVATLLEHYKGDYAAVASKLGRSERWVRLRERVHTRLAPKWRKAAQGDDTPLTMAHLELIVRLEPDDQERLFEEVSWDRRYRGDVTVEDIARDIDRMCQRLDKAGWKLDAEISDEKGKLPQCSTCIKRTGAQPMFWQEPGKKGIQPDRCLGGECFGRKTIAALKVRAAKLSKQFPNLQLVWSYGGGSEKEMAVVKAFPTAVKDSQFCSCKAKDKGAVPCLMVHGREVGKLIWQRKWSSSGSSAKAKPSGPKPLAEKRKELESKRWCTTIKRFQDWLESDACTVECIAHSDKVYGLLVMTAWLGTELSGGCDTDVMESRLSAGGKAKENDMAVVMQEVWDSVKPVLSLNVTSAFHLPTKLSDDHIELVKTAAKFVGYDIEGVHAQTVEDIPEPKSWKAQASEEVKKSGSKEVKKSAAKGVETKAKKSKKNLAKIVPDRAEGCELGPCEKCKNFGHCDLLDADAAEEGGE